MTLNKILGTIVLAATFSTAAYAQGKLTSGGYIQIYEENLEAQFRLEDHVGGRGFSEAQKDSILESDLRNVYSIINRTVTTLTFEDAAKTLCAFRHGKISELGQYTLSAQDSAMVERIKQEKRGV